LTAPNSPAAEWYLDNCYIVDSKTGINVDAKTINFSTQKGMDLMNNNWECKSGDSEWMFNMETCSWQTLQGTKTLLEVREEHISNSQGTQSFLGM